MICPKCKNALPYKKIVCPVCGNVLNNKEINEMKSLNSNVLNNPNLLSDQYGVSKNLIYRKKENKENKLAGFLFITFVLLIIIILVILLNV